MVNWDRLYALLNESTPLPSDCGSVCGAACCHGDRHTGMLLFPGEPSPPQGTIQQQEDRRLFVCRGHCDRAFRPLACRIFPLFPYLTSTGQIRAVYDPRAYACCPLVRLRVHVRLRPDFVRRVRQVGHILMQEEKDRAFLQAQSREIDELNRFLSLDEGRSPICRR